MKRMKKSEVWTPEEPLTIPGLDEWCSSEVSEALACAFADGEWFVVKSDGVIVAWFTSWDLPDEMVERDSGGRVTRSSYDRTCDLYQLLTENLLVSREDKALYLDIIERAAAAIREDRVVWQ
jgi:hypothetical protein